MLAPMDDDEGGIAMRRGSRESIRIQYFRQRKK